MALSHSVVCVTPAPLYHNQSQQDIKDGNSSLLAQVFGMFLILYHRPGYIAHAPLEGSSLAETISQCEE